MDLNLAIICLLTFVIHLIGTLAYSARIAGVRTRRIAISFALFNILILVSRTSNSFQGPFLAKRVEETLLHPLAHGLISDFRWPLCSATAATIVGAFLIPACQRVFSRAVLDFQVDRSMPRLLLRICFREERGLCEGFSECPRSRKPGGASPRTRNCGGNNCAKYSVRLPVDRRCLRCTLCRIFEPPVARDLQHAFFDCEWRRHDPDVCDH